MIAVVYIQSMYVKVIQTSFNQLCKRFHALELERLVDPNLFLTRLSLMRLSLMCFAGNLYLLTHLAKVYSRLPASSF